MGNSYKNSLKDLNDFSLSQDFYRYAATRLEFSISSGFPFIKYFNVYRVEEEKHKIASVSFEDLKIIYEHMMHIKVLSKMTYEGETPGREVGCQICFERYANVILACGHAFCDIDIIDWKQRNQSCPICRSELQVKDVYIEMEENHEEIVNGIENSLQVIFSILERKD
ncbi:unnamed protein product [Blepharisma stoltei]|uniref:RING-type domain-containing protein n=1 Tax=Blepharisma stoltei TaxID=1481888 RepID=A0AAU9IHF6_9CILI|nr:unnamed protein product [Blepharisma stoltei]